MKSSGAGLNALGILERVAITSTRYGRVNLKFHSPLLCANVRSSVYWRFTRISPRWLWENAQMARTAHQNEDSPSSSIWFKIYITTIIVPSHCTANEIPCFGEFTFATQFWSTTIIRTNPRCREIKDLSSPPCSLRVWFTPALNTTVLCGFHPKKFKEVNSFPCLFRVF